MMRPISLLLTDLALLVIPGVLICGQLRLGDRAQRDLGKVSQTSRASRSHSLTGENLGVQNLKNVISVDRSTSLQEAINSAPNGGTVFIPPDFSVSLSSSLKVSKDIHIIGGSRVTSSITAPFGAVMFKFSGTARNFRLENLTLNGNGVSSALVSFSGITSSEGWIAFHRNVIQSFGATAITTGTSTYVVDIRENTFNNNAADISIGDNSDAFIENNFFNVNSKVTTSVPRVTVQGPDVHIRSNFFIRGTQTNGPDILISPTSGVSGINGLNILIYDNKFGGENETTGRIKIEVQNAKATNSADAVHIFRNYFCGAYASPSVAIRLTNPAINFDIDGNFFEGFSTIIDDAFTDPGGLLGGNIWGPSNIIEMLPGVGLSTSIFTNGGRGFTTIFPPAGAKEALASPWGRDNEQPELRNRLAFSEDLSQANWSKSGISITTGQTDPLGTSRAMLLTRSNLAQNELVSAAINSIAQTSRFIVKLWAKAGSTDRMTIGLFDNTVSSTVGVFQNIQLGASFKQYKANFNGLNRAHSYALNLYPAGNAQSAGTLTIFGIQVSDYDSDYYPTTGSAFSDTTSGNRWEKRVIAANQIVSSLATGTPPIAVASTTPVANLTLSNHPLIQSCGTTSNCSHTMLRSPNVAFGSVPLLSGTPSTATVTGISPAFASSSSYNCTLTNGTNASNGVKITYISGSSFTIAGPNTVTDVINYICVGN
jgi:hypothetical protein